MEQHTRPITLQKHCADWLQSKWQALQLETIVYTGSPKLSCFIDTGEIKIVNVKDLLQLSMRAKSHSSKLTPCAVIVDICLLQDVCHVCKAAASKCNLQWRSDEALALEILICAPVEDIALCILELLLHLCLEAAQLPLLVEGTCIRAGSSK